MAEVLVLCTLPGIQGMPSMLTYTELLPGTPNVWSPFCSSVLVFGIWKYWFSNEGGHSARLAPLFYSCCDTGVVLCATGFSDSLAEESQGGLLNRVAMGRRDDQGVKC